MVGVGVELAFRDVGLGREDLGHFHSVEKEFGGTGGGEGKLEVASLGRGEVGGEASTKTSGGDEGCFQTSNAGLAIGGGGEGSEAGEGGEFCSGDIGPKFVSDAVA